MPDYSHVSWIAVIVAAVAHIVLGYLWYMPMVFGKRWEAAGGNPLPTGAPPPMTIAYMVVSALLAAVGMALWFSGSSVTNGAISGVLVWLYFVAPVSAGAIFFQGRTWMWWAITAGYWLVGLVIMGVIVNVIH
ncbi:MAG: hypothetical protein QOJ81_919 [Chloroflexota bacterium]|nr:hypothetical protein [Chloroflexota bacterium]